MVVAEKRRVNRRRLLLSAWVEVSLSACSFLTSVIMRAIVLRSYILPYALQKIFSSLGSRVLRVTRILKTLSLSLRDK